MNTILQNPDYSAIPTEAPASPYLSYSPSALRTRLTELSHEQEALKAHLQRQEQATRNAVGVSVLSVVLAAASITFSVWVSANNPRSGNPLVASSVSKPANPILATIR